MLVWVEKTIFWKGDMFPGTEKADGNIREIC